VEFTKELILHSGEKAISLPFPPSLLAPSSDLRQIRLEHLSFRGSRVSSASVCKINKPRCSHASCVRMTRHFRFKSSDAIKRNSLFPMYYSYDHRIHFDAGSLACYMRAWSDLRGKYGSGGLRCFCKSNPCRYDIFRNKSVLIVDRTIF